MDRSDRSRKANILKAAFNKLFRESTRRSQGTLPYMDMVRIADALRHEGPSILERVELPPHIDTALELAIASVDPNEARFKETVKKALSLLTGGGSIGLAWIFLGQIINPGAWAAVVALFAGGVAAGPVAVLGLAVALSVAVTSAYVAYQRMTPNERATQAHAIVMKGIDEWVKKDGGVYARKVNRAPSVYERSLLEKPQDAVTRFPPEELAAFYSILDEVARVDGRFTPQEMRFIKDVLGIRSKQAKIPIDDAIALAAQMPEARRIEIASWAFGVAYADSLLHDHEAKLLKVVCKALGADHTKLTSLFDDAQGHVSDDRVRSPTPPKHRPSIART